MFEIKPFYNRVSIYSIKKGDIIIGNFWGQIRKVICTDIDDHTCILMTSSGHTYWRDRYDRSCVIRLVNKNFLKWPVKLLIF